MLKRLANSWAFRSGPICRALLNLLPVPRYRTAPEAPFVFITMAGAGLLDMLREQLASICCSWSVRPRLVICSDGSVPPSAIERSLAWWRGPKEVMVWQDSQAWARREGFERVAAFCESEPVGKKLAFALHQSSRFPDCVWSDADCLWFRDLAKPSGAEDAWFAACRDYQPAYDRGFPGFTAAMDIRPPFVNSGVMWFHGHPLTNAKVRDSLGDLPAEVNHFTEQTWVALNVMRHGFPLFETEQIYCSQDDQKSLRLSFMGRPWSARHYVGPVRHVFWRDALALRFGFGATGIGR